MNKYKGDFWILKDPLELLSVQLKLCTAGRTDKGGQAQADPVEQIVLLSQSTESDGNYI